jgi:hypothetical protein
VTDRLIVAYQLALQNADQDDMADKTGSSGATVVTVAHGGPGASGEVGELRDDEMGEEFDAIVFAGDSVADGIGPGDEDHHAEDVMAPMALGPAIYSDYDYLFGMLSFSYTV